VATTAHAVGEVVHEGHRAHPEAVVRLDQIEIVTECVRTFDVEHDAESTRRASSVGVGHRRDHGVVVGVATHERAEAGGEAHLAFERHVRVADVDADDVHAGLPIDHEPRG